MISARKNIILEVLITVAILAAGTMLFLLTDLDLQLQRSFYHPDEGWHLNDNVLIQFLYRYSNLPALIISIGSLLVLAVGFSIKKYSIYRKICLYLLLTMIIGPGLIVNSVFKENWGRPRPRHIEEFGGRLEHLPVIQTGTRGAGKSFPCGHASMGYYFFTLYFIFKAKRKKLAAAFFVFALVSGTAIGFGRMVQGGHFASDVLWSAGFNYLTAMVLFYLLKLHKSLYWVSSSKIRIKKPITIAIILLSPVIAYYLLLSTPYYVNRHITFDLQESPHHIFKFHIEKGDVNYVSAPSIGLAYEATGFAFPGGKLVRKMETATINDTTYYHLSLKKRGSFNELNNRVKLYLAKSDSIEYYVSVQEGDLRSEEELSKKNVGENKYQLLPDSSRQLE